MMKRQTFGGAVERVTPLDSEGWNIKKKEKFQNEELGSIQALASIDTFVLQRSAFLVMSHAAFDRCFLLLFTGFSPSDVLMSANYGRRLITASYMGPQSFFLYTDCFALIVFLHISLASFQVSTQNSTFHSTALRSRLLVFVIKLDLTNLTTP